MLTVLSSTRQRFFKFLENNTPGVLVATVIALAAKFISEHYGAPSMLMALLLGIAFHFLSLDGRCQDGIALSSKTILRWGIVLLGARISVDLLLNLGVELVLMVVAGVILTISFSLLAAKLLGCNWKFALLTGGSVAICGASAAMAIAAVLPKDDDSERNLIFTILGVTVLSTVAMIVYPFISSYLRFNDLAAGVFIGGSIHDVAQVVGAGFSISNEAGETATLIKLFRVAMLAPVVLVFSLYVRSQANVTSSTDKKPPLMPIFVVGFLVLAAINSFGFIPTVVSGFLAETSRWFLLISIAAVGMKTSLKSIFDVGRDSIILIVAATLFIGIFIVSGILFLGT